MIDSEGQRPSPDALLNLAQREGRGSLKIFIGAAPGVGKTFSMLRAAQAQRKTGVDVVIGIVETHQRSETDIMTAGLEVLPRLTLHYRGIAFQEMDLDAILARKPALVLVDELAHSNIPGTRHSKRYQDVKELLDNGINVYSTLNIQHLESLNDIVTRITGVTVRETIPDSIVQEANSIELIDLTPEELLQRLKDGKIYIPEQARLAMGRFFTPGNLTALRELALRQAAARVDDQMTDYMRQHAIAGPWPASDRVLVCIGEDGQAISLIRTAKRSADRRQSPWIVMYVETHRYASMPESTRLAVVQALHLAESLGAEILTVAGENIADEVLRVARNRNVSVIIIGKSQRSLWSRLTRPSVAARIMEFGGSFDILIMSTHSEFKHPVDAATTEDTGRPWYRLFSLRDFFESTFAVLIASLIAYGIRELVELPTLSLIYLIGILLIAVDRGFQVSAYASLLSFTTFNFFFVKPRFSFLVERSEDFVMLTFFLVVALAISLIGDRLKRQVVVTRRNAERTQALYDFNKNIASINALADMTQAVTRHVAQNLNAQVILLMPQDANLVPVSSFPENARLDTASGAAMNWCWRHNRPAGLHTDTLPAASFFGLPLRTPQSVVGVLAIRPFEGRILTPDQENFITSVINQSAVSIERIKLADDVAEAHLQTETERLRASLLASVSHDLREPLSTILGATSSLHQGWDRFDDKARFGLLLTVEEEANRLNRFVQNMLDMTQLVAGGISLHKRPIDIHDLMDVTLAKLRKQLGSRPLRLDIPAQLRPIDGDIAMLEQVLGNVIDNACKYAPPGEPITIAAREESGFIGLTVTDRGFGIPAEERERIFDMFYRIKNATVATGAGLGLAISRGYVEAHGGKIRAQSGPDGIGTQIVIHLPTASSMF